MHVTCSPSALLPKRAQQQFAPFSYSCPRCGGRHLYAARLVACQRTMVVQAVLGTLVRTVRLQETPSSA